MWTKMASRAFSAVRSFLARGRSLDVAASWSPDETDSMTAVAEPMTTHSDEDTVQTPAALEAWRVKLVGDQQHFDGYAGTALGDVPTVALRRARAYFATRGATGEDKAARAVFQGQVVAIDRVLDDRRQAAAGSGDSADLDRAAGNEDPFSPMVLGRRIAALLTHPVLTDLAAEKKVRAFLEGAGGDATQLKDRIDRAAKRLKIAV
jgi:hypothetical protein